MLYITNNKVFAPINSKFTQLHSNCVTLQPMLHLKVDALHTLRSI